jgi:hypothetical protein
MCLRNLPRNSGALIWLDCLGSLFTAKREDQLDQANAQGEVTDGHKDLIWDMPANFGEFVKAIQEIQDKKDYSEQFDPTANEAVT